MEIYTRYCIPDEKGETRRAYNERYGKDAPPFEIPPEGKYLWDWFQQIADGTARFREGIYHPVGWIDLKAWAEVTGTIVYPREFDILRAMDAAFCKGMNINVQERRERALAEAEKNRNKR